MWILPRFSCSPAVKVWTMRVWKFPVSIVFAENFSRVMVWIFQLRLVSAMIVLLLERFVFLSCLAYSYFAFSIRSAAMLAKTLIDWNQSFLRVASRSGKSAKSEIKILFWACSKSLLFDWQMQLNFAEQRRAYLTADFKSAGEIVGLLFRQFSLIFLRFQQNCGLISKTGGIPFGPIWFFSISSKGANLVCKNFNGRTWR